jgi:hypothetical protein
VVTTTNDILASDEASNKLKMNSATKTLLKLSAENVNDFPANSRQALTDFNQHLYKTASSKQGSGDDLLLGREDMNGLRKSFFEVKKAMINSGDDAVQLAFRSGPVSVVLNTMDTILDVMEKTFLLDTGIINAPEIVFGVGKDTREEIERKYAEASGETAITIGNTSGGKKVGAKRKREVTK